MKLKRVRNAVFGTPKAQSDASTGFTLSNLGASSIADRFETLPVVRLRYTVRDQVNSIAADAAEGFGIKLGTLPAEDMLIVAAKLRVDLTAPDGLGSTAGEIGVGTVIGTGAVAVLSATSTFEDIVTGQTMTGLTKAGSDTNSEDHDVIALNQVDAAAGSVSAFLNIASTWDQTSAENLSVTGTVDLFYIPLIES